MEPIENAARCPQYRFQSPIRWRFCYKMNAVALRKRHGVSIMSRFDRRANRSGSGLASGIVFLLVLAVLIAKLVAAASGSEAVIDAPLLQATTTSVHTVDAAGHALLSVLEVFRLPAHLKRLREMEGELALLRTRNQQLEEVARENERLRGLLKLHPPREFGTVAAEVVARSMDLWFDTVVINRGANAGIKLQDLVVNGVGVVGEVAEVGANHSKVRLITSPDFALSAVSNTSQLNGIVRGTGGGQLSLGYIAADAPLKLQEKLFTSGLSPTREGGARPRGLLLGYVAKIKKQPELSTLEVSVRPAVSGRGLRYVLVLTERVK